MNRRVLRGFAGLTLGITSLLIASSASARPLYFDQFTTIYSLSMGEDLYACGVCHRRWEGTGGRNPYGLAVEQQLYLGKTITDAILDIALLDSDLDGFSNFDEITTFGTLPGYSCANYTLAIDPPPNFQSIITPGVPSCLEPMDIEVAPSLVTFVTAVGQPETVAVTLINNGTDFPITVSAIAFLPGADASLSVSAPATPFALPVGASVAVDVTFSPAATIATAATLRVSSDDPDEPDIDVAINALGFVLPLAPVAQRAACFESVDSEYQIYARRHLRAWMRCYVDEVSGRACDAGRRDFKAQQAEDRLRRFVGGEQDQVCAGQGLIPINLGIPVTCGGTCDHIAVNSLSAFADCLVCRQEAATSVALAAVVGTSPPDLPANTATGKAAPCQARLAKALRRGMARVQGALANCELANISAVTPADCATQQAAVLNDARAKTNRAIDRCQDTTGLAGCLFALPATPTCLGDTSLTLGTDLVDASFGLSD